MPCGLAGARTLSPFVGSNGSANAGMEDVDVPLCNGAVPARLMVNVVVNLWEFVLVCARSDTVSLSDVAVVGANRLMSHCLEPGTRPVAYLQGTNTVCQRGMSHDKQVRYRHNID